jgi:3-oxoadipate enol-lactonase
MLVDTPPDGYGACCGAIGRLDLREVLGSIASPTLVIAGAQDQSTPPEHGRAIAASVPGAQLQILSQAAHLANVECAADVTRLIVDHLEPSEAR